METELRCSRLNGFKMDVVEMASWSAPDLTVVTYGDRAAAYTRATFTRPAAV